MCVCVSEGKKKSFGEAAAKFREASSRHRKTNVLTAREREQRQLVVSARRPPRERTENVRRHSHRRRRRRRSEQHRHRHRVVLKSVSPCVCVCVRVPVRVIVILRVSTQKILCNNLANLFRFPRLFSQGCVCVCVCVCVCHFCPARG